MCFAPSAPVASKNTRYSCDGKLPSQRTLNAVGSGAAAAAAAAPPSSSSSPPPPPAARRPVVIWNCCVYLRPFLSELFPAWSCSHHRMNGAKPSSALGSTSRNASSSCSCAPSILSPKRS